MDIKQEVMNRDEVAMRMLKELAEHMDEAYGLLDEDTTIDENDALYAFYLCFTDNLRSAVQNLQRAHGRMYQLHQKHFEN